MWIAFIFQYLWDTQQLNIVTSISSLRCELLSFFSIFGIHNNKAGMSDAWILVVNCFHFSVSLGYTTTLYFFYFVRIALWIAFIFQYLWDTQQLIVKNIYHIFCCELLSFFSIFGIHNNTVLNIQILQCVVNCFHFSVSLGYTTTCLSYFWRNRWLWIAFIFQYLWDTQQRRHWWNYELNCCELLSFFSIFGIHNNTR